MSDLSALPHLRSLHPQRVLPSPSLLRSLSGLPRSVPPPGSRGQKVSSASTAGARSCGGGGGGGGGGSLLVDTNGLDSVQVNLIEGEGIEIEG